MISINNKILNLDQKSKTVLVLPKWGAFSYFNALYKKQRDDNLESLLRVPINDFTNSETLFIFVMTPNSLINGSHLEFAENWNLKNKALAFWATSNPAKSGKVFKSDCYPLAIMGKARSKMKFDMYEPKSRILYSPTVHNSMAPGIEMFNWVETVGYPPYTILYSNRFTENYIPDNWYYYKEIKEDE